MSDFPRKPAPPWTEEERTMLRRMWDDKATASTIAECIGRTRNAVIGQAHRMDLPMRPSPILRGGPPRQRKRRVSGKFLHPLATRVTNPVHARVRAARIKKELANAPVPVERVEQPHAKLIARLTETLDHRHGSPWRECQWIEGDGTPWTKCVAPTLLATSYCLEHAARCFKPHDERRDANKGGDDARS